MVGLFGSCRWDGLRVGLSGSGRDGVEAAVPSYTGFRFPVGIISDAVWLYRRFPLGCRGVEELLAGARGRRLP
jgi:hypothetical protein